MKLPPRLQAIADWIEPGARLADIGTDHGLLPVYCVLNGAVSRVFACDINESPLRAARRNAAACGAEEQISFVLSPGLEGLEEGSADTIAVAGMGGETIVGILSRTEWIRREDVTLLLQPQSKIAELQAWLRDNGFAADRARLVKDGGRIYLILRVLWNGSRMPEDPFFLGLLAGDALRGPYAAQLLRKTEKQLLAFRDGRGDPEEKRKLAEMCRMLREASAALSGNAGE